MATTAPTTPLRRVIAASMIGTTVEWYDFFLRLGRRARFQQIVLP